MSTRSTIAVRLRDGSYRAVYCHWDGYIKNPGVGWMLQQHYNSQELAEKVTSLGSLNSLGRSYDAPPGYGFVPPSSDYTVAHHRARKEPWGDCEPGVGTTYDKALERCGGAEEYNYLWDGKTWLLMNDDPKEVIAFAIQGSVPA